MSKTRQAKESVLVRFWAVDHHRTEIVSWPVNSWNKLVYASDGVIQSESSSQFWVLPSCRALWVHAGEEHRMKSLGKAKVRTLYFPSEFEIDRPRGPMVVSPLLKELIVEASLHGPLFVGNMRHEALSTLLRIEIENADAFQTGVPMPRSTWLYEWATRYLESPHSESSNPFSGRTLARRMQEETGLSIGRWCYQARAVVGFRALSLGATVGEAASEAGYATSSGFIQAFNKFFGTSPGKFRHHYHL